MKRWGSLVGASIVTLLLWLPGTAAALFHFAEIDEIMTSYGGDPNVQFV